MQVGIGIGSGFGSHGGPGAITGSGPILAALAAGDDIAARVTWGSYAPTAPATSINAAPARAYSLNGGAFVAFASYVVAQGDTILVRETPTDNLGRSQAFLASRQVPVAVPVNTVLPAISGTATEGQTLTRSLGTWTGLGPITYATQWRRGGVDIPGATGATYVLTAADVGATITARVTATNAGGSAIATSAATGTVLTSGYQRVVFIGASIMEQTFGRDLVTPNATRTAAFRAAGLAVDVYGYGWSGYVVANIRAKVIEALAAFPANTLFVIHIGGNNVSNTRPYATATTAQKNAIIADYNGLIADIGARKGDVILCPTTFRTYEAETDVAALPQPRNAVFSDEALGSKPYNDSIFIPAIAAWRPETMNTDGNPVVDLYNATRNVFEAYVSGDGVHPVNPGGRDVLAQIFIGRLGHFVNGGAKPAPVTPRGVNSLQRNGDGTATLVSLAAPISLQLTRETGGGATVRVA